jgi:hypothetical protein
MKSSLPSFILASFIGSFFYLIFGWFIFDFVLGSYTEAHTIQLVGFKKTNDFNVKITSSLKAFLFCSLLGVLIGCMTDFYWYASSHFYSNLIVVILDLFGAAISVGSLGLVNHFILRNSWINAKMNNK